IQKIQPWYYLVPAKGVGDGATILLRCGFQSRQASVHQSPRRTVRTRLGCAHSWRTVLNQPMTNVRRSFAHPKLRPPRQRIGNTRVSFRCAYMAKTFISQFLRDFFFALDCSRRTINARMRRVGFVAWTHWTPPANTNKFAEELR